MLMKPPCMRPLIPSLRACPSMLGMAAAIAALLPAGEVRADGNPQRAAAAMALYDQAIAAIDAGDYETACPKIEEALKLEPSAIGARVTLGECYEGAGRLASAWAAFVQAEQAAEQAGQTARQMKAHERAEALRPRLAQLRIVVSEAARAQPGLKILRDGTPIGPEQWNVPIPVDKGSHVIVVQARGKQKIVRPFEVDSNETVLNIPMLRDAPDAPAPEVPKPDRSSPPAFEPGSGFPGQPRVHLVSDDRDASLSLYQVDGTFSGIAPTIGFGPKGPTYGVMAVQGEASSVVCTAPCDRQVDGSRGQQYFLGGDGLTSSSHFRLNGSPGELTIRANPGSKGVWALGLTSISLGLSGVVLGPCFMGAAASAPEGHRGSLMPVGGAMLGVGALLIAIGIPTLLAGRTTYSFEGPGVDAENP